MQDWLVALSLVWCRGASPLQPKVVAYATTSSSLVHINVKRGTDNAKIVARDLGAVTATCFPSLNVMTNDILFAYPLRRVSDHQLQELGRTLWDWKLCGACLGRPSCSESNCPWSRSKRLAKFWAWYKEFTGGYVPDLLTEDSALRTHGDLHAIIKLIKTKPDATRAFLTREYFAERSNKLSLADQEQAFNMAIAVLMMVNCSRPGHSFELLEHGSFQSLWRKDVPASQFVSEVFVAAEHPYFDKQTQTTDKIDFESMLAAKVLKKRAGLRFQGTTDLRHHLALNRKEGVVEIFHHTAVLKECLLASKDTAEGETIETCLPK